MTMIECPNCSKKVDIDDHSVRKEERGTDLAVECNFCNANFLVARIKHVRQKLQVAEYGFTQDERGQEVRIRL